MAVGVRLRSVFFFLLIKRKSAFSSTRSLVANAWAISSGKKTIGSHLTSTIRK